MKLYVQNSVLFLPLLRNLATIDIAPTEDVEDIKAVIPGIEGSTSTNMYRVHTQSRFKKFKYH